MARHAHSAPAGRSDRPPEVANDRSAASPRVGGHGGGPSRRIGINRLFGIHLAGVGGSNLADGVIAAALPLIAIGLTRDPLLVSLTTGAFWLPWLLGSLLVGVAVDRGDRARIRHRALMARLGIMLAALVVVLTDALTIWALIALVLAHAVTEVFSDLAADALIPQLVGRDDLPRANSRIMGMARLMQEFIGLPIGGALVTLGTAWVFGVAAGLLALVVVLLFQLTRPGGFAADREVPGDGDALTTVRSDAVHGITRLWSHDVVRPLTIAAALSNLVFTAYMAVFVLWVVGPESRVGLEPWQYPVLLMTFSAGAIVGSLVPSDWSRRSGEVRVVLATWIVNGLLMLLPVIVPTWWSIAVTGVLVGATNMVSNVIAMSIRQRVVPLGLLGRIGGASRTLSFGSMAIGGPLGGIVASQFGLATVLWTMPAVAVIVTLWLATQIDQDLVDQAEIAPAAAT